VVHELRAKDAIGRVLVVRAAYEAHVLCRRFAAARDRLDVIEFEPGPLLTAPAALAHECTPFSVAFPHRALHRRRDVASRRTLARTVGTIGRRELLLSEFAGVASERILEGREDISRRIAGALQRPRHFKQIVGFPIERELEPEALGRERSDFRMSSGRRLGSNRFRRLATGWREGLFTRLLWNCQPNLLRSKLRRVIRARFHHSSAGSRPIDGLEPFRQIRPRKRSASNSSISKRLLWVASAMSPSTFTVVR
jgi:hypothetical protein